jgi:hypothetical protein
MVDDKPASEDYNITKHLARQFLEACNAAYTELKQDPERWQEELEERALWEATLADGLDLQK